MRTLSVHLLRAALLLIFLQNAPSRVNAAKRSRGAKRSSGGEAGGGAVGCGLGDEADFDALLAAAARVSAGGATATACLERAVSLEPLRPEGYQRLAGARYAARNVPGAAAVLRLGTRMFTGSNAALGAILSRGLGQLQSELGNPQGAMGLFRKAVRSNPGCAPCLFSLAAATQAQGRLTRARELYAAAVLADPRYAEAWNNLGNTLRALHSGEEGGGDAALLLEARLSFQQAVEVQPRNPTFLLNLASTHAAEGEHIFAARRFREATEMLPAHAQAYRALGSALSHSGEIQEALLAYRRAEEVEPDEGVTRDVISRLEAAIEAGGEVDAGGSGGGNLEVDALVAEAIDLEEAGMLPQAIEKLERGVEIDASDHAVWNRLAILLLRAGRLLRASAASRRAVALKRDSKYLNNLGASLYETRDIQGAVDAFQAASEVDPLDHISRFNLANALTEGMLMTESIKQYERVLELSPSHSDALANKVRNQEAVCDWRGRRARFARLESILRENLAEGKLSVSRPWHALSYPISEQLLLATAQSFAAKAQADVARQGLVPFSPKPPPPSPSRRMRVAYVSYCFSAHPTSYLIAGLFRLHDRTRFESVCFSLVTSDGSRPRGEIEADCGTFRDVSGLTVAESSRELNLAGVHVAVNLDGWTSMGRTNEIFAMSPAPIQVQYMGFPGSLGASYVHLLVTDKIISPPELAGVYAEKLVVLPNYYINDYRRQNWTPPPRPSGAALTAARKAKRLPYRDSGPPQDSPQDERSGPPQDERRSGPPEDQRIGPPQDPPALFANFNNLYKLSPSVFALWLSILAQLPRARIAMLSLPEDAQPHLRRFASVFSQGGDKTPDEEEEEEEEDVVQDVTHRGGSLSAGLAERVEFVEMMPREQHLERAALTDAFLDTLLVNAHTTAMDMTWAGVPVVTRPHVRFSSRVAASVLTAAACTHSLSRTRRDYVATALALARNRRGAARVRECLAQSRLGSPLFDSERWVRDWERSLAMTWDARAGARGGQKKAKSDTARDVVRTWKHIIPAARPPP